jgi:hypothetical protein
MKTAPALASFMLFALLLSGCHETRQEFVLNPDGSGKVIMEALFHLEKFNPMEDDQTPDEKLKGAVRSILEESEGVEAWRNVSFRMLEDGRGFFGGTAYFPKVAELKFHNLGNAKMKLVREEMSRMNFEIAYGGKTEEEDGKKKPSVELSDEETEKELVRAKHGYTHELRPMLVALLANMREEMLFLLPGAVREDSNLKADVNGNIPFVFDGSRMIEVVDQVFEDDELLRREIKSGSDVLNDNPSSGEDFQEKVFGVRPPFSAVLSGPFYPLFDYREEVEAAKANYAALTKDLGIVASIPVMPPLEGEPEFTELKIGGVRLIKFTDLERGIRPFNYDEGYTLSVIGELSGPVVNIEEGEVLKAIADTGADLLPKKDRDRRISFPDLSKDNNAANFDVSLSLPGEDVGGIRELSGTMTCFVASGSRDVDLGISEFKPGAEGKEFNAVISSIGKNKWGKGEALAIKLELPKEAVKEIKIYDKAGTQLKFTDSSISWGGNQSTFTQVFDPEFPERGRIVVSVYEQPKKLEVPFRIENISLLGTPLQ